MTEGAIKEVVNRLIEGQIETEKVVSITQVCVTIWRVVSVNYIGVVTTVEDFVNPVKANKREEVPVNTDLIITSKEVLVLPKVGVLITLVTGPVGVVVPVT